MILRPLIGMLVRTPMRPRKLMAVQHFRASAPEKHFTASPTWRIEGAKPDALQTVRLRAIKGVCPTTHRPLPGELNRS